VDLALFDFDGTVTDREMSAAYRVRSGGLRHHPRHGDTPEDEAMLALASPLVSLAVAEAELP